MFDLRKRILVEVQKAVIYVENHFSQIKEANEANRLKVFLKFIIIIFFKITKRLIPIRTLQSTDYH